jgi:hypothetical protein
VEEDQVVGKIIPQDKVAAAAGILTGQGLYIRLEAVSRFLEALNTV